MNKKITAVICGISLFALSSCAESEITENVTETVSSSSETETEETTTETTAEETTTEETTAKKTKRKHRLLIGGGGGKDSDKKTDEDAPETEYSVDLKNLSSDTDFYSLTNAEKHSLDEEYSIDLDGDGTEELLDFSHIWDDTENLFADGAKPRIPYINGEEAKILFADIFCQDENAENQPPAFNAYANPYSNFFYIVDIDSSDKYKEIALTHDCGLDDFSTYVFRWEGDSLKFIYEFYYDTPDPREESAEDIYGLEMYLTSGNPIIFDGSGVVASAARIGENCQTWFAYRHFSYNSETGDISPVYNEAVYPYGFADSQDYEKASEHTAKLFGDNKTAITLKKPITVYESPDTDSESSIMEPQPVIFTAQYDTGGSYYSESFTYVLAEDGTKGWIHYTSDEENNESGYLLADGTKAKSYDLFDNLIYFD